MTAVAAIHAGPSVECELPVQGDDREREREMEVAETQRAVSEIFNKVTFCVLASQTQRDCICAFP